MNESDTSRHFLRQWIEKDVAEGRTGGKVVTRFPPEPNGYIHIGHAKAVCLDFGMAELFGGECHLRLDDTNPTKESDEYAENIKKDIRWLGFNWSGEGDSGEPGFYNASNMFEKMYEIAENLIKAGQAYCCNLGQDEWKEYRGVPEKPGRASPSRDTTPERNLEIFRDMKAGKYADGEWCLRAKIDMASPNIHFRDPVIYRIRHVSHYHLGDKWCIYPMYDFAHPIEDALEGVTHSMCTLEFEVHRPLYDWVVDRLDEMGMLPVRNGVKIRTEQREFARLNITYTVMSKRLLLQLVTDGHVNGWDDPRMPTVCGMRRRGYTPGAIREFCERVGVTKVESESDPALLEWCVREELNKTALRRMAVVDPVKVVVDNWGTGNGERIPRAKRVAEGDALAGVGTGNVRMVELPNNPLDESAGMRQIPFSGEVWIDRADFMEVPEKKFFRMAPGQEVRLRGACIFKCTNCVKNDAGEVVEIHGTWDPESWGGNAADGRKVKGTIHWVDCSSGVAAEFRLYDKLFTEKDPLKDGSGEFLKYMNPESLKVVNGYVEPLLAEAKGGERFQFERTGYFIADEYDHTAAKPVFNRTVTLKDSYKPAN
ncbi:MAG: glutamine--tRNA ligase/YqeY domain fusion protein [Kiritimatiellae bacterium]|nr:glutamine--tRNA ligase/YqeY domain fusion protein [Kiritimatiellia bacterium]